VDPHQLETKFLILKGKIKISSSLADLLLDVPLDACLDMGGCQIGTGRGRRGPGVLLLLMPATCKPQANYQRR
jgi:hypothetical protein